MSSEQQHTPGPWMFGGPVERDHKNVKKHPPIKKQFWEVGQVGDRFPPGVAAVNSEADARLIAEAPELLRVLKIAAARYRSMWFGAATKAESLPDTEVGNELREILLTIECAESPPKIDAADGFEIPRRKHEENEHLERARQRVRERNCEWNRERQEGEEDA